MKYKEVKEMSSEELQKKYNELKKELTILNWSRVTGATDKNVMRFRSLKKDIAKVLTALNEKE